MKLFPDVWPFEDQVDGTSCGVVSSNGQHPCFTVDLKLLFRSHTVAGDVLVLKYAHPCFVMPIINFSSNVDVIRTVIFDALESFP